MQQASPVAIIATCCLVLLVSGRNAEAEFGTLACMLSKPGDAPASDAPTAERTRQAQCTFRATTGAEEKYVGTIYGVSLTSEQRDTVIWVVRGSSHAVARPGMLERTFASDPNKQADQKSPLVGAGNSGLTLHFMSDRPVGSASASEKPPPAGFAILRLELKLKSAAG